MVRAFLAGMAVAALIFAAVLVIFARHDDDYFFEDHGGPRDEE